MHFIMTTGWEDGVADLTQRLAKELTEGKRVLWLVSGGSNIDASVQIMDHLTSDLTQNLSIMLVDERYGPQGHPGSNWAQLLQAGFDPGKASLYTVLEANLTFEGAVERYLKLANQAFAENDLVIAQLGIGTDGHIAGILPDSPAAHETEALISGFEAPPHKRMTLTFPALSKVDAAYVFAFGESKREALQNLRQGSADPVKLPAQILTELPEAYIYNDQLGDSHE